MIIAIYIILIVIIYYLGHILSLFSSVAYLESEELEEAIVDLRGYKKKYLALIIDNPRISIQIAAIFKSFALVAVTILGVLLADQLVIQTNVSPVILYPLFLVTLWLLYLVFMEYLPRRRVLITSEKEIIRHIFLFAVIFIFFEPFLNIFSRVFASSNKDDISEEQKEDIVERAIETLAERSGVDEPIVEEDEKEMIGQIFLLDQTEVREVMVPRISVKGFDIETGIDEIRSITKELGFSRYPVYDGNLDKIVGILYIKDIFTSLSSETRSIEIREILRKPYFVPETKIISDLLSEFKKTKTHIAIVIDEYGGTAGIVTLEDILEEIVGEIQDEHDSETPLIEKLPDNSYKIDASISVEDLADELNLDYDTKEFETVGGLIYDIVGSVPSVGATLRWKDIQFEIENVDGQRIVSVRAWVRNGLELKSPDISQKS